MGTQDEHRATWSVANLADQGREENEVILGPTDGLSVVPVLPLSTEAIVASMPIWSLPHGKKAAISKTITREIRLPSGARQTMRLSVLGTERWGLPTVTDLEFFYGIEAWLLQLLDRNGTVPSVLHCAPQTLFRLMGKSGCGKDYRELYRFLSRITGTTIALMTRTAPSSYRRGRRHDAVFHIYDAVYLPGQPSHEHEIDGPMDHIRIKLSDWYRNSLVTDNHLAFDHQLFRALRTPLGKLLSAFLHHLFALQEGVAMQRYSHLVEQWQLAAFSSPSRIKQQFLAAHDELVSREFLSKWELRSMNGEFAFLWEAGPSWWRMRRDRGEPFYTFDASVDPFMETSAEQHSLLDEQEEPSQGQIQDLWEAVRTLSGYRKDPEAWERWWRRAIEQLPPAVLWRRIGEVRELQQRGRVRNPGSYLATLVRADAKKCGASWA